MSDERRYSLAEIRAAFWSEFHASGELWFPYPGMGSSEEECEEATARAWQDFEDALNADAHGELTFTREEHEKLLDAVDAVDAARSKELK